MERHELASPEWIAAIHALVRELLADADLSGVDYCSSEEFANPPPHLSPSGASLGWHMIVRNGTLTLGVGPLPRADRTIRADYATVAPWVSIAYKDNPEGEALVRAEAVRAAAEGLISAFGERPPSAVFPQLSALHDRVAAMTRPA